MITEFILGMFADLLTFLVGLMPEWTVPTFVTTATTTISDALAGAAGFAHYIAIKPLAQCLVALLAVSTISFAIRFSRIGLSAMTGGGGSAG